MNTRTRSKECIEVAGASATLRRLADSADPALWAKAYQAAKRAVDPDAELIATMSPAVAVAAADFLDEIVKSDDEHSVGLTWTNTMPDRALRIARAVNGGQR